MRKLTLDLRELQVESFAIDASSAAPGTVRGREYGEYETVVEEPTFDFCAGGGVNTVGTCIGPTYCCLPTWRPTCANTCYDTCAFTCDGANGCEIP